MSTETKNSELLTVIIPVYNTAPYLRKCLDSICGQTYRNLEIICVDDGSVDNSLQVLKEYASKDSRVRVFHQENSGQGAARNLAMKHAHGDYIAYMDSDDYLDPTCYEKAMQPMLRGSDLVVFGAQNVDTEGNRQEVPYYKVKFSGQIKRDENIHTRININVVLKIFKRSILDRYNITFLSDRWYEDVAYSYMYMSVIKNVYGLQEILYHRLVRPDSTMGQTKQGSMKALDFLEVEDQLFCFLKKHDLWDANKALILNEVKYATTIQYKYIPDQAIAKEAYTRWIKKWNLFNLFPDEQCLIPFRSKSVISKFTEGLRSVFYRETDTTVSYRLLGIPILKTTRRDGTKSTRLFGIKVSKRPIQS